MTERFARLKLAVCVAMLAGGLLALVLTYLQHKMYLELFFNSDASYLPNLFRDVVAGSGQFKRWYLTPAPYIFPDWPLFFAASLVSPTPYGAVAVFFVLQALLLCGLAAWLARQFVAAPVALACGVFATLACCDLAARGAYPYIYVLLGSYHFGTFLAMLCVLGLLARAAAEPPRQQPGHATQAAIAGLTALAVMSDRLYILQFALPALFTLAVLRARIAGWRALAAAIVAGCALGVVLYKMPWVVANGVRMPWKLSFSAFGKNLRDMGGMLQAVWHFAPLLLVASLAGYGVLLAQLHGTLRGQGWRMPDGGAALIGVFCLASLGAVAAVVSISKFEFTVRYFIPAFILPLVLWPALLARMSPRLAFPAVALAALLALGSQWRFVAEGDYLLQKSYYPADVACVDNALAQRGLKHGVADYWNAGRTALLSKAGLSVAPLKGDMSPQLWITTLDNFRDSYDFALVNASAPDGELGEARVVAKNGAPQASVQCGAMKVLAYPAGGLRTQ